MKVIQEENTIDEDLDFNVRKNYSFREIVEKDGFYVSIALPGTQSSTSANYGVFYIASRPCEVVSVSEAHTTAGSDGGSVELNIERLSGTEALGSGDEILISDFSLKGTANTVSKKEKTDLQNTNIKPGDRIALKDTGTLTAVAGVCVTLYLKPTNKGHYE